MVGVRPLMRQMAEINSQQQLAAAAAQGAEAQMALAAAGSGDTVKQLPGAQGAQHVTVEHGGGNSQTTVHRYSPTRAHSELVNLASVQGGVRRGWIETVSDTIEGQPEESLRVVKAWLAEEV